MGGEVKLITVIRHRGDPIHATTLQGRQVERKQELWVVEWRAFVTCAPYDDHFVYDNPVQGQPAYMCTCGSAAVVAPSNPLTGKFVCMQHAKTGQHMTGGTRWV